VPTGALLPGNALMPRRQQQASLEPPISLLPPSQVPLGPLPVPQPGVSFVDRTKEAGFGNRFGTFAQPPIGMIIHHTGARGSINGVINTFKQRGYPAQFVIDRDGTIYQTLPDGARGQHVMNGWGPIGAGKSNANVEGVEVIAANDKDVTPEQQRAAWQLVQSRAAKWGYDPSTSVWGHGEVNPGHKEPDEGMTIVNGIRNGQLQQGVTIPQGEARPQGAPPPTRPGDVHDPSVPTPGGLVGHGNLSPQQIYQYALNAGFPPEAARTMTAITLQESGGGNPYAYNPNDPGGSYGLTQVNAAAHGADVAHSTMGNPQEAMRQAYRISENGTNFKPWGSYTDGSYRQHLEQVAGLSGTAQAPTPAPPPYVAAPPGSGMATGLAPAGPVPNLVDYPATPAGSGMLAGGVFDPMRYYEPPGTVAYNPRPLSPLMTGGAVPRAVVQQQVQDSGAGGPASLPEPNLGPAGGPDEGPPGEMTGHQMLSLAAMLGMGALRGVPVTYDPFKAIAKMDTSAPRSAFGYSQLGLAPPGRDFAAEVQTRQVPGITPIQSPFSRIMGSGGGDQRAVATEIGAQTATGGGG